MIKILRLWALSTCTAFSAACTTYEPLRPDMEARPLPSRADEIAYINELRQAYVRDQNGQVPCYEGRDLKAFRPKYVQGYAEWDRAQEAAGFDRTCFRFAKNPGAAGMTRYLESGFGLTDLYCQRYFTVATETRQSRKLQRGLFKTSDTFLNAVMGALSVGANPIAISSAAFSGIDSGYGAIDDAFVVAPSREDVRKLVLGAQQKFRADVFTKDTEGKDQVPASYAAARATIERYAGLCTFDGMRQLVADAVNTQTDQLNASAADVADKKGGDGGGAGGSEDQGATADQGNGAAAKPKTDRASLIVPPPISAK